MTNIVGEVFLRGTLADKRIANIVGCIQLPDNCKLDIDETFYLVTGNMVNGVPRLFLHFYEKDTKGLYSGMRVDQVLTWHTWRKPELKKGQFIGPNAIDELIRDYFS